MKNVAPADEHILKPAAHKLRPSLFSTSSLLDTEAKPAAEEAVFTDTSSLSSSTYYDLPLALDATEPEARIYDYLQKLGVRMSHPSMKFPKGPGVRQSGSSSSLFRKPNLLLTKRNKGFSQSFRISQLSVQVPGTPRAAEAN